MDNLPPVVIPPSEPERRRSNAFRRFWAWLRAKKYRLILSISAIVLVLGSGIAAAIILMQPKPAPAKSVTKTVQKKAPPKQVYYSQLTGIEVADEAAARQPATAIMIENSPDARPQSGLKQAGVVYEAIAEGGITRFLAIYQEAKPQLIGPVRSLRMYYVDWLAPYNASVAHVGGSAAALTEIRNGSYRDIDQFFNASYYWRATDRYAPHNVYTSFEKLDALNSSKGYKESTFVGFTRADGTPNTAPTVTSIDLTVSSAWYNPHYDYEPASNTYLRSINGVASEDREEGRIAPSVVIGIKVNMTRVVEDGYRESIQTTGTGEAVIFQNGTATPATWSKASRTSQMQFLDAAGKPIALNRGQTWITAIPATSGDIKWQ
ncbi:MAG: DUF3048 domain-containing protein [Candidatus Saccharimonas sp.]